MADRPTYDLIVVGSSFASMFFLTRYLELDVLGNRRVLVLEKGKARDHAWITRNDRPLRRESHAAVDFGGSNKKWAVRITLGGASNSWWACTPRYLPEDFALETTYGIGVDWPVRYDELEPFYCEAERIMSVSGSEDSPSPRSEPYPQPPHRFSLPDQILKRRWGRSFVHQPNARARLETSRKRAACCAAGTCHVCPADAKFTILNEMSWLFDDPRVELTTEASVESLDVEAGVVRAVVYHRHGRELKARGDLIALGANAIFNPFILLKSGLNGPQVGRGLCEQVGINVVAHLYGVDNFQGSTSITGHGYPYYGGTHRSRWAGCLIETWNVPELRHERGKYRHFLRAKFIFEDFRKSDNRIEISSADPTKPYVVFDSPSDHTMRGIDRVGELVQAFLAPLPLEKPPLLSGIPSQDHILGTVVMGDDPRTSVVDRQLVHHQVRNLLVLGGSAFPTAPPANPTLTIAALSLWSADRLLGGQT